LLLEVGDAFVVGGVPAEELVQELVSEVGSAGGEADGWTCDWM
jgi:hypothetical protein